jgi:hypothetical protein
MKRQRLQFPGAIGASELARKPAAVRNPGGRASRQSGFRLAKRTHASKEKSELFPVYENPEKL